MTTTIGRRGGHGGRSGHGRHGGYGGRGWRRGGYGYIGPEYLYDDWPYAVTPVVQIVDPTEDDGSLQVVLGEEDRELARSCGAEKTALDRRFR